MRLIVPLAKRIIVVEIDEHDFQKSTVDEAVNDAREDMAPKDSSGWQFCVVRILQVVREGTSNLLEGPTEHEDHQLRKRTTRPPDAR